MPRFMGMDWQEAVLKETLQEYLMTFEQMTNKLEALDRRIEELAQGEKYKERVKKLVCLLGVMAFLGNDERKLISV